MLQENPFALAGQALTSPVRILHGHSLLQLGILGGAVGLGIWGIAKVARMGLEEAGILSEK